MDEPLQSRDELRLAYADAWRKQSSGAPLTPLEAMLADVIALHPEYHTMLQDSDAVRGFDLRVPAGEARVARGSPSPPRNEPSVPRSEENPFLHMGLHMAVREQVAIDRPPGTREVLRRLEVRCGHGHDAEHLMMEALAETLWEAQRTGRPPDDAEYLKRVRIKAAAL